MTDINETETDIPRIDAVARVGQTDERLRQLLLDADGNKPTQDGLESFNLFFAGTQYMKKLGNFITNAVDNMAEGMSNLMQKLRSTVRSFNASDYQALMNLSTNIDYYVIAKRFKLFTPAKLKGRWLPYVEFLVELTAMTSTIDREVLAPLQQYFAQLVNNPQLASSATFKPKFTQKDVDGAQNKLKKFFVAQPSEYVYWGEAFGNNKEFNEVIAKIKLAKDNIKVLSPDTVRKSVETLSNRAQILSNMFSQPSSVIVLNPKQSKYLSELLFDAARLVELYTIGIQLVDEIDTCLRNSAAKIQDDEMKKQ